MSHGIVCLPKDKGRQGLQSLSYCSQIRCDLNTTEAGSPEPVPVPHCCIGRLGSSPFLPLPCAAAISFFCLEVLKLCKLTSSHLSWEAGSMSCLAAMRAGDSPSQPSLAFALSHSSKTKGYWTDCSTYVWAQTEPCGACQAGDSGQDWETSGTPL